MHMHINAIVDQCAEDSARWFPQVHMEKVPSLIHHVLALAGEVGELANIVKKIDRGDFTLVDAQDEMEKEVADIMIYLANIAAVLQMNLASAVADKTAFNERRFGNGRRDHPSYGTD
jgi:NTP pyrophosphatase (non-canonical NTP hydrolase)